MTAKKNLLVLCLLSSLGALSPIAHGLELVNVPEASPPEVAAPADSPSVQQPKVESITVPATIDVRLHQSESPEVVLGSGVSSTVPVVSSSAARNTNTVNIEEIGVVDPSPVSSFGNNVPFTSALSLMLPEGWSIHLADSLRSIEHRVSWREGENRLMALTRILNNHPQVRSGRINWDSKTLFVFDKPMTAEGQAIWDVTSGKSLRTTLTEWAAFEGWSLVWDPKHDFVLGASARYQGTLPYAIEQLIGATARANKSLDVNLWGQNRVIHVTERKGARL